MLYAPTQGGFNEREFIDVMLVPRDEEQILSLTCCSITQCQAQHVSFKGGFDNLRLLFLRQA